MTTTAPATAALVPDTGVGVLEGLRERQRTIQAAEAEKMMLAAQWAAIHSRDSVVEPVTEWCEQLMPMGGEGAPEVAEFAVAELAAALGMSTDAGRAYLSRVVEIRYRLRRVWGRVVAGDLPAWRAGRIAEHTLTLSPQAAAFVDRHVAPVAHQISVPALDRLVEEARVRFDPEEALDRRRRAAEHRRFDVETQQVSFDGTVRVEGTLDLADALALEDAVAREAQHLAVLGSTESLHVRRARAVGNLARDQLDLDLAAEADGTSTRPAGGRKPKQLVVHVHLAAAAVHGQAAPIARVENTQSLAALEQVAGWCRHPGTEVTIKPVLDLAERVWVGAYEVPDRIKDQTILRDGTCVFPHCTRPARRCDHDHRIPYNHQHPAAGGQTETANIAPLCRHHHRVKTTGGWHYDSPHLGVHLWTSPHGLRFRRDHTGTQDLSPDSHRILHPDHPGDP